MSPEFNETPRPTDDEAFDDGTPSPDGKAEDDDEILSLSRDEKPVKLKDPDGTVKLYMLREMSGLEKDDWLNGIQTRIVGGKVKENKNAHASLIARCLYDDMNRRVPIAVISSYPSSVQLKLFKKCETLNGLDLAGREAAKNG